MTPREALEAAARVCAETGDKFGFGGHQTGAYVCQQKILALAEQEDQRGAAEITRRDKVSSAGSIPAQSAPHPDPAGQASSHKDADEGTGEPMRPALPGPDSVSLPREPTEAMLRPFYGCPPDELRLAWETMLTIVRAQQARLAIEQAKGGV